MENRNKTVADICYSTTYQLLLIILPLITTPYVSRVLGAEQIGVYSYYNSIAAYFVMFACLGVNNHGSREIVQAKAKARSITNTFSSIYGLQIATSLLSIIAYYTYVFSVAENTTAAMLAGLFVISSFFDLNWVLVGLEEFRYSTIRSGIVKIVSAVFIFLFVKSNADTNIYIAICCGTFLASNLLAIPYLIKKRIRLRFTSIKSILVQLKPMLVLFIPILGMSIYKYMNKIVLKQFAAFEQVGFLESSERVLLVPISFVIALGNVMMPKISRLSAQGKSDETDQLLDYSMIIVTAISSAMGFGIIAIIKDFVPLFYGEGFNLCESIIPILMISPIFLAIANVVRTQFLIPNHRDKEYVTSILFGAVVDLSIALLLIPRFGAIGAAIATTCTEFAVCSAQVFMVRKSPRILTSIKTSIPYILNSFIMCCVIYFIKITENVLLNMVIKVCIGIVVIAILDYITLRLTKVIRKGQKK